MIRKFLLVLGILSMFATEVEASHYMGGEITWQCLPNGNFRFIMKVYRECAGINYPLNGINMTVTGHPTVNSIQMNLYPNQTTGRTDMSPVCNGDPNFLHIDCPSTPSGSAFSNSGAVEEWYYTSDASYPNGVQLAGVPPPNGWIFAYTSCCRNPCTNITGSSSKSWYLRAIMFPYNNTNNYPCWDNSPIFAERPSTVICTSYPFTYNHNAYDIELDSLSFEWAQPLEGNINSPITSYAAGYSYTSPLPGTFHNPNNVNSVVNPNTGEISFTSYTAGAFVTVTKVTAFKCGIKIAEIFREMQIVLLNCGPNDPPDVTAPFQDTAGLYTLYTDTVFAGATVSFLTSAIDTVPIVLPNGQLQTLKLTASGSVFGNGYTSTTAGCVNPPCAILTPPPPVINVFGLATTFSWETTCAHLETNTGCGGVTNVYTIVLKVSDDYCPAPGININTISIVVENAILEEPEMRCVAVEPNGDITIGWAGPDTMTIPNTLHNYFIYHSTNPNGPFALIDSTPHFDSTSYTHVGVNGNTSSHYYRIQVNSGCYGKYPSGYSNVLTNMILDVTNIGNNTAHLVWSPVCTPALPTHSNYYEVFRETVPGNWAYVGNSTTLTYDDVVPAACGNVNYRVELWDTSGCRSVSTIDGALFQSAEPSELRCISVEANGDVTLNWMLPADLITELNFSSYQIYTSNNINGPYILRDSVTDVYTTSYTDVTANGISGSVYYYIRTKIFCNGYFTSGPSDTLSNIMLNINKLTAQVGQLTWNPIRNPLLPTSSSWYNVYRVFPPGNVVFLDSTQSYTYNDTMLLCHDSVFYRVEVYDSSGCYSKSAPMGEYFYDDVFPDTPELDSVSVDHASGFTMIGWTPGVAGDIVGYIIYHNDGIWSPIDTVWGKDSTFYIDTDISRNPCHATHSYALASFDSCGYTSPIGVNNVHNTIFLEIVSWNPCNDEVILQWNSYLNMDPPIAGYNIYTSENGNPAYLLGTNLGSGSNPPSTMYSHRGLNKDSEYCYYVQAFNADASQSSTSCIECVMALKPAIPQYLYLRYATIEENAHVKLLINVDTSAYVNGYKILRASANSGPYDLIATLGQSYAPNVEFIDYDAYYDKQSYFYKVITIDSCGNDAVTSQHARTIYLKATANNDYTNVLEWNDYEGWSWASIMEYNLYRTVDGIRDPIPIATLGPGKNNYIDDVSKLIETQGKFSYEIEALQGPGIPDFQDTSISNESEILQYSRVFIPNAFSPKGYNVTFKPINVFVDITEYMFTIYNRWGQQLFETHNPDRGWDGVYNGEYVPGGAYVYYIKFITSTGDPYEKRGTVTVIY